MSQNSITFKSSEKSLWLAAMGEKVGTLEKNNTLKVLDDHPKSIKPLPYGILLNTARDDNDDTALFDR